MRLSQTLRAKLDHWIAARMTGTPQLAVLRYRQIYILPTKAGLGFAAMLLLMWLGSINYSLSMGFMLTFLLAGVALVSMHHTFGNLVGLQLTPGRAEPVFAGQSAHFPVLIHNNGKRPRYAVGLRYDKEEQGFVDVAGQDASTAELRCPTRHRGVFRPGRFAVITRYPSGLFHAWSWVELDLSVTVYPAPEEGKIPPPPLTDSEHRGQHHGEGQEDFKGTRRYQAGDSPKHIAWKAVARGREVETKQFTGEAQDKHWFDYDSLAHLQAEHRLSRLCRWLLDAEADGQQYGLRLPGQVIPVGQGQRHLHTCLSALSRV